MDINKLSEKEKNLLHKAIEGGLTDWCIINDAEDAYEIADNMDDNMASNRSDFLTNGYIDGDFIFIDNYIAAFQFCCEVIGKHYNWKESEVDYMQSVISEIESDKCWPDGSKKLPEQKKNFTKMKSMLRKAGWI